MIAVELNARGITAPKGGAWAPGQVWRALDQIVSHGATRQGDVL